MLSKLVSAYEETAKGKKTLIFNNGINTSISVYYAFRQAGLPIVNSAYPSYPPPGPNKYEI